MKQGSKKKADKNAAEITPLLVLVTVLSVLTSFAFIYYGLTVTMSEGLQQGNTIFAYVVAGYGLGNIYVLSAAWRDVGNWPAAASKLIGFCFLGVLVFDTLNAAVTTPSVLILRLCVALVICANWFSIRVVCMSRSGKPTS